MTNFRRVIASECEAIQGNVPLPLVRFPAPLTMPPIRFLRGAGLALMLSLASCATQPTASPVALSTTGGDAWTFDKVVEGSIPPGACDSITLTSPDGSLTTQPAGGRFIARVPLRPGENRVDAQCRKAGAPVGAPAEQHWSVRLTDGPHAAARTVVREGKVTLDAGASRFAPVHPALITHYEWRARPNNPAPLPGLPATAKQIVLTPPAVDGEYYVTLRVTDSLGRSDESTATFRVRNGSPESIDLTREHPAWVDRAVVYGVDPFVFGSHGLADVTARLDDLAALGITVLWLSPITQSAPQDFGYAVTDPFRLDPRYGSDADLRTLIREAHARGMKVIIDFVSNHLSDRSTYFTDAAARERQSPYFDYFARTGNEQVAHYFDWKNLANLNYDNPEVQNFMIAAFAHWLKTYDVDGFRVDAAWGPRRRAPEFWPRWRAELKRIRPDIFLLAEASARNAYYFRNGFDAAYDWTASLGQWAWREAFDDPAHTASRLRLALSVRSAVPGALTFRFLDNNDTGVRFVTRYGVPTTRVAAAMLLTLPGIPSLYTGQAVGAAYKPYRDRKQISWADPMHLRPWYTALIRLRETTAALRSHAMKLLDVGQRDHVLAYEREGDRPGDSVLVLLNYGATAERVTIPREALRDTAAHGSLIDLMNGKRMKLNSRRPSVTLPPYGVRIVRGG
ncbi:MAG TPA: alpha-amylase family glycosyl hydrolase [Alphaproteobacteria bacterium]|nr:alpha-amylase family glycosyl hydrolase [Alphaproteobacteria bacterium]